MAAVGPQARTAPAHLELADLRRLELDVVMTASAWMIGQRRTESGFGPASPLAGPGCRSPCDVGPDLGLQGLSRTREDAVKVGEGAAVADRVVTGDGNLERDCLCRWTRNGLVDCVRDGR